MFGNEFFFYLPLLSFAALLCLFGVAMLIDGIIRLTAGWHRPSSPTSANSREREESTASNQAA
jgi:uncharacterized membrane protein HdeD (DUF308 family)